MVFETICKNLSNDGPECIHIEARKITVRKRDRVKEKWFDGGQQRTRTFSVVPEEPRTVSQ
jgi:hypothetical protein